MNTERTKPDRSDTRRHILDCGHRLVAAKGFVGVGLAEILAIAEVPKGSFYYYFASKEAFGAALLDNYFEQYQTRLAALPSSPGQTGGGLLLIYFKRWIETQRGEDPTLHCLIVKLAAEIADLSDTMRHRMLAGTEDILAWLAKIIARGQADGSIGNTETADSLAQFLYEAWLGASLLAKLQRTPAPFDAVMRRTCTLLQLR